MRKILSLVLLLGCITPLFGQSGSGATIWFYRPAGSGDATRVVFAVPARRLAALQAGELFALDVQPGVYRFGYSEAPGQGQSVVVAVSSGQQVYVEANDQLQVVAQERALANIQASQGSAPTSDAIVPQRAGSASSGSVKPSAPERISAPAPFRATTPRQGGDSRTEALNAMRRAEITWNLLSYGKQGAADAAGGSLALTVNINERVGIVGDVTAHRFLNDPGNTLDVINYRFGPKLSNRAGDRVTLFSQFLFGGTRIMGDQRVTIKGISFAESERTNGISLLVGGGVDLGLTHWLAWRAVEGGYSAMHYNSSRGVPVWSEGLRLSTGVVFRIK